MQLCRITTRDVLIAGKIACHLNHLWDADPLLLAGVGRARAGVPLNAFDQELKASRGAYKEVWRHNHP
jgi:hypothetical protein